MSVRAREHVTDGALAYVAGLGLLAAATLAAVVLLAADEPWTWTVLPVALLVMASRWTATWASGTRGQSQYVDLSEVGFVVCLVLLPLPLGIAVAVVATLPVIAWGYRRSPLRLIYNASLDVLVLAAAGLLAAVLAPRWTMALAAAVAAFVVDQLLAHPMTTTMVSLVQGDRLRWRAVMADRPAATWLPALSSAVLALLFGGYVQQWGEQLVWPLIGLVLLFAAVSRSRLNTLEEARRLRRTLQLVTELHGDDVGSRTTLHRLEAALHDIVGTPRAPALEVAGRERPEDITWPLPPRQADGAPRLLTFPRPPGALPEYTAAGGVIESVLAVGARALLVAEAQEDLRDSLRHDALTGLLNRTAFTQRAEVELARAARSGAAATLLYVDLDGFKAVNDTFGHDAGDDCLRHAADVLRSATRAHDLVARLGGDEFAVLVVDLGQGDAEQVADRVREVLAAGWAPGSRELVVSGSVGLARYPVEGTDTATLLSVADRAMYADKRRRSAT